MGATITLLTLLSFPKSDLLCSRVLHRFFLQNTHNPLFHNGSFAFYKRKRRKKKGTTSTGSGCQKREEDPCGKRCFLSFQGSGSKRTGSDEKRRERMGRIPLLLTNMVYCVSVWRTKKQPQTDLGLRFCVLLILLTERGRFRIRHFAH